MLDTRETRGAACEIKFLLPLDVAERVRAWARAHMRPDPHGTGPWQDEYVTTTLYFDTAARDVLHRRGSYGRAKYRVRRYGTAETVYFERKLRRPGLLVKRRTADDLSALAGLESQRLDPGWAAHWFHRRLLARKLEASCQVTYTRTARVSETAAGSVRLTLDTGLHAVAANGARFAPATGEPFLDARAVLELKYREHVPAVFRQLVEEFAVRPQAASKYRLAMEALLGAPITYREPACPPGQQGAYA